MTNDEIRELEQRIAHYEQRLRDATNAADRADFTEDLHNAQAKLQQLRGVAMTMTASDGGTLNNNRQIVAGVYYEAPPDSAAERPAYALRQYLRWLRETCNTLQLGQIDTRDAINSAAMQLSAVYINLYIQTTVREEFATDKEDEVGEIEDQERYLTRRLSVLEAIQNAPHVLLLGKPGSGKSTFINHLALCLAGEVLHQHDARESAPADGWLSYLGDWPADKVLPPIRIVLREWAADPRVQQATAGSVKLFEDFLRDHLEQVGCAEAFGLVTQKLSDGTALLLLDGWDEVVGKHAVGVLRDSIVALSWAWRARMVVTCRVLDYAADPQRKLPQFAVHELADFDDDQISQFVVSWYAHYTHVRARPASEATTQAAALGQAITELPDDLRELARLPLLLTVMAIVHADKGTLPDARALLYDECINILLLRWRQPKGQPDLLQRLKLPNFRDVDLLKLMAQLGYAAHTAADRDRADSRQPADLDEPTVMRVLAQGFAPFDAARKYDLAETMLHALATGNGVLLKRGPDTYAFPHRSFQEYLAGRQLANQPNSRRVCCEHASKPHWHEALLLLVGYKVFNDNSEMEFPLDLVRDLLESREPLRHLLAGEMLVLIKRERVQGYNPMLLDRDGLWDMALTKLAQLARHPRSPLTPPLRAKAGRLFGTLCYGSLEALTQPDVVIDKFDPQLPLALVGTQVNGASVEQHPQWRKLLDRYWRPIEAGPFWFEAEKGKLTRQTLPYAYRIARYPVTVAEYARFIAAGGYTTQRWWTPEGWKFIQPGGHPQSWTGVSDEQPIVEPRLWDESRFNHPSQPVIGVSWYEATAYCLWLTEQGHSAGWLPAEAELRLPTALEWERAARHTDRRWFPWGDAEPMPNHANFKPAGIGAPSPVGCFPTGNAECGAADMAGNVMEWLATPWDASTQFVGQKDLTPDEFITLTYSYYSSSTDGLRCGSRIRSVPNDWNYILGFRCCWFLARRFSGSGF